MADMNDLAAWLRAQLDVDQANAAPDSQARADVDAKRRIVDRCASEWGNDRVEALAEDVLRELALMYSARPDYRAEWQPLRA
ncbi:DUF6221 family protein [Dactylosporangium sp. NPDC000521]|uniref:DUF6221 family protein n=1 Tax=Dactylosporangium sp. NPDC000521 TaxID=3363975 RepID=UPI003680EAD5